MECFTGVRRGLIIALLCAGCGDRSFRIDATYEAPVSSFRLEVTASGQLEPGADVAEVAQAKVKIVPLHQRPSQEVVLEFTGAEAIDYTVGGGEPSTILWSDRTGPGTLHMILRSAGYTHLLAGEVEESVKAVHSALAGPKGCLLDGQTTHLRVVEVSTP